MELTFGVRKSRETKKIESDSQCRCDAFPFTADEDSCRHTASRFGQHLGNLNYMLKIKLATTLHQS